MPWHGPYQIRDYLERAIDDDVDRPPERSGVYVITKQAWKGRPQSMSGVLYVGGNTGRSARFRTRIGDLLADMLGFFGESTGHHSGGQSLCNWCKAHRVNPLDLYIGWQSSVRCGRCAEMRLYEALKPELNKNRPSKCAEHG